MGELVAGGVPPGGGGAQRRKKKKSARGTPVAGGGRASEREGGLRGACRDSVHAHAIARLPVRDRDACPNEPPLPHARAGAG